VRELEGIIYYNDTAATSPDGAISGVNSFSEPVVLICGGSEKNLDMSGLGKVIAEKVKKVVLLKGDATDKIRTSIKNNLAEGKEMEILEVGSMDQAVRVARGIAEKGDVVLLSPGTASFGMFLNEFDRGDKFKEAVLGLSQA